jgi:hypothetical protein
MHNGMYLHILVDRKLKQSQREVIQKLLLTHYVENVSRKYYEFVEHGWRRPRQRQGRNSWKHHIARKEAILGARGKFSLPFGNYTSVNNLRNDST